MIRTKTETISFPQAGWLKTLIVERIRRIRLKPNPQAALKETLSQKFKVVEGKRK